MVESSKQIKKKTDFALKQDVRIVFTAPPKILARLVRFVTKSSANHVYLEYPSTLWSGRWAAEATLSGVRKVMAKKVRKHIHSEFRISFDPRNGMNAISDFFGEDYDYLNASMLGAIKLVYRWTRIKLKNPFKETREQFCSELLARFLKASQLQGTEEWNVEASSPKKLLDYCRKNPEIFEELRSEQKEEQAS